ncbi:MAG: hypothetical protein U5K84_00430 [Alkalibacterium sp.]|nr:hypothetical protein [Alkalibacterium sp.]
MKLKDNCWTLAVNEDLKGHFYTYSFVHDEDKVESADIYSKAVGLNGNRSAIIDMAETNPESWDLDTFTAVSAVTEAMIWEVHTEDFSSDKQADFSPENRGNISRSPKRMFRSIPIRISRQVCHI